MTIERLSAALSDRYRIERELGAGGMATVYLAEDLKHHRKVAVKVLRGEISATLGAERFSREISVAANLQHPHILPLLDSGESGGFFYYVMPYIEGESLRDRLAHHGELPIHEAVRIVSEVADALAHAHGRGVVHRDIKPDNIMMSGRHAIVMDFGVAKAVSEATGPHKLTSVGIALGTPTYMAPEQAAADPLLDHRVDIYALGVLAYELLTGKPPFDGRTPQEVLAAHVTRIPEPVETHRPAIPPALSAVVMKCLAKRAADRWQSAEELVQQLEPLSTPSGGMTPTQTQPVRGVGLPTSVTSRKAQVAIGAILLVAAIGIWHPWSRSVGRALDPDLVAVLPFRVAGTDPSLQYLRQGMVDLLQTKLTGEGGPRAADARAVLAAVRDAGGTDAIDISEDALPGIARRIGAGKILQGSIVGPTDHIVISASLVEMPGGGLITQTSVEGTKDSLFPLVDRLTAQLLALGAGATTAQLSGLTTTNLEALRAYLDGQAEYRRGNFDKATPTLEHAVQLDSTFALALSALDEANGWFPATVDMGRVDRLAWQYRDRLSERDREFLSIRLGSAYPAYTPWDVRIADREALTRRIPESAEAWYDLGDGLFHFGALADASDIANRARLAFEAALARDSLYGGPMTHLARLASLAGDTAEQRRWTLRYLALDSTGRSATFARWDLASKTGDVAGAARILDSTAGVGPATIFLAPFDTSLIRGRDAILARAYRTASTSSSRAGLAEIAIDALRNAGRPLAAAQWLDTLKGLDQARWSARVFQGALFSAGRVQSEAVEAFPVPLLGSIAAGILAHDLPGVEASVRTLRAAPPSEGAVGAILPRVAAMAEAWLAVQRNAPDAPRLLASADSAWKGIAISTSWSTFNLERMYEQRGQPELALRAIRRRLSLLGEPEAYGLTESLRIEGRLAARVGDKSGAILAYQRYLTLRMDPEPSLIPQRDSVRRELAALGPQEGTP